MGRSQRLRLHDVRRVMSLIGRLTEEPERWRFQALDGLRDLLGAAVGITIDTTHALPGDVPRTIEPVEVGWATESARRRYIEYFVSGEVATDPATIALLHSHQARRFVTRTRRQFVGDVEWYASPTVSEARKIAGIDDFVSSTFGLRPGVLQGFGIYRACGDTPFNERERRLLRLFHVELLRLLLAPKSQPSDGEAALSPRLRETLELLLAGNSIKQIAVRLGLSRHTINDYQKALYARLGVATRGELLSRHYARHRSDGLRFPDGLLSGRNGSSF